MQNHDFTQTRLRRMNLAAKTISWFMHGMKFRLYGAEQARV